MQPIPPGGAAPRIPRGHPTSATAEQDSGPAASYPRFHAAVALAQLTSWLPADRQFLIDISGPGARTAAVAAIAGHCVLRVIDPETPAPPPVLLRDLRVLLDLLGLGDPEALRGQECPHLRDLPVPGCADATGA